MATASARHILVNDEAVCNALKEKINSGEITFEDAAKQNSTCPSGARGGDLGNGPVKTQFGYHLLEVTERS